MPIAPLRVGGLYYKFRVVTRAGPTVYLSENEPEFVNLENGRIQVIWAKKQQILSYFEYDQTAQYKKGEWLDRSELSSLTVGVNDQIEKIGYVSL